MIWIYGFYWVRLGVQWTNDRGILRGLLLNTIIKIWVIRCWESRILNVVAVPSWFAGHDTMHLLTVMLGYVP